MKMSFQRSPASPTTRPFNLDDVQGHLRAPGTEESAAITNMAHTAAAEIEQFAQIALLTQTIQVTIFDPDLLSNWLRLPIGPASEDSPPTVTVDGVAFTDFSFVGGTRPGIRWGDTWCDLADPIRVNIEYTAGFGAMADDIPHDLAQAIMDQTALHFDGRSPMNRRDLITSPHMTRIGARYRGVQA